jgi:hypothetical protein
MFIKFFLNIEIEKFSFKQNRAEIGVNGQTEDVSVDDPILTNSDYIASCFEYKCENSKLFVVIKQEKYRCRSGEILNVKGYSGGIFCPENENLCNPRFNCKFGCVDKYSNNNQFYEFPKN